MKARGDTGDSKVMYLGVEGLGSAGKEGWLVLDSYKRQNRGFPL